MKRKPVVGITILALLVLLLLCGCASIRTMQGKSPNYPVALGDVMVDWTTNQLVFLFHEEGTYAISFSPANPNVNPKDLPLNFSVTVSELPEEGFYEFRQKIGVSPDLIRVKIERVCSSGTYNLPTP